MVGWCVCNPCGVALGGEWSGCLFPVIRTLARARVRSLSLFEVCDDGFGDDDDASDCRDRDARLLFLPFQLY